MRYAIAAAAIGMALIGISRADEAAARLRKPTDIPAQTLRVALQTLSRERDLQFIFRSDVVGAIRTPHVSGELTVDEALTRLLSGTSLTYKYLDEKTVTIVPAATAPPADRAGKEPGSTSNGVESTGERFSDANATRLSQSEVSSVPDGSATAEDNRLEEVLVTAQKRTQSLNEVPLSVTALSGDELRMSGIDTMQSLSYSVPSLVVEETGGGFQSYFLRGIANANASTSLVGVYLDEADVTTNSNSQLGLRAIDLERVEVLKGPQGTLYGAGSAGGTIRFITKDPELTGISGSGDVELFTTKHGDSSQRVSGVLNLPLVEERLGVRIVGTYGNLGGWIDQPATGRSDINDQNLRDVRVKTLWKPNEAFSLKALIDINRNDGGGTNAGADRNYQLTLPADPTARTPFDADYDIYNLTGSYDFSRINLLSSTTYMSSFSRAPVGLKYPISFPPDPDFEFLNNPDTRATHSFSQEVRLSSNDAAAPLHWVTGVFYKELDIHYTTEYVGALPGVFDFTGSLLRDESSKSAAAFADGSYDVSQRWSIGGGVRYFRDERSLFDGENTHSATFHHVDPRVYASFAPTRDVHFYASVADGFRSGGFNAGEDAEEPSFKPEKVRSYELGTKASLFERRLSAQVALFYSRYSDIQLFRLDSDGFGSLNNAGTAHVKGVDWSFDWQATDHLLLSLSGNATRARLVSLLPGVEAVVVGDHVDYSRDYAGRVAATYAWSVAEEMPAFVHVEFAKVGPAYGTDRSLGGPPVLFQTDVIDMLDARLGFSRSGWSYELFGENLTNANGLQDTAGTFGFASRPRPRTIGVQIRAEFR